MNRHLIASMLLSCFAVSTQATAATDLQYHFSNSLLTSIRNCYKYNEEFTKINPDLADMDATCQRFDIKINGILSDKLCHATITHKTQNHGKTTYRCKLTRSQRNELYNAIMTRSAEPITSTFTVFEEYEEEDLFMDNKKMMSIVLEDGTIDEVEVLLTFELVDLKKQYIVYTKNEVDENGNVTIYISTVTGSGDNVHLTNIETEEEWTRIKEVLRELSKA